MRMAWVQLMNVASASLPKSQAQEEIITKQTGLAPLARLVLVGCGGNDYDFFWDLSTIVYPRPGGHADLYLLSQK
jgi:hypothetical protein